jgi:hypothetical protein
MNEQEIIQQALGNLEKSTRITNTWKAFNRKKPDGELTLKIDDQKIRYYVEIKKELRNHQLQTILAGNGLRNPLMIVATRLFPKIKEELRHRNIAYLEANGNIFLKQKETMLWIDSNKPVATSKETGSRAFTKTGLKVVFQFLTDETWINRPYRQIAELTGTGIGNISNIINGLKQEGFLLPLAKNKFKLDNKKALLDKWAAAYDLRLKPELKIGRFRFLNENDFNNWKQISLLTGKTWWGAEPAGDLLTHYLRPARLTLYTMEDRSDLIKNYRLIPDEKGNIEVYKAFWPNEETLEITAPPLLVYADLLNIGDRRSFETAEKIYHAFLQDQL